MDVGAIGIYVSGHIYSELSSLMLLFVISGGPMNVLLSDESGL